MIGHSFGARILYAATSQVLMDEIQRQHPGESKLSYGVMAGRADLILLLNPALEASVFTAMDSVRRPPEKKYERIHKHQQPLLLAISTENDTATTKWFPRGQRLAFARKERQRQTLGNYMNYVTHTLQDPKLSPSSDVKSNFWYDHFESYGLLLQLSTEKFQPGNPFMVARTTEAVINGHSGLEIRSKELDNGIRARAGEI